MTADLILLWAERDAAKQAWQAFLAEADAYTLETDPVVAALYTPRENRTAEQHELINAHAERQSMLLGAVLAAERAVRVATGHEKPQPCYAWPVATEDSDDTSNLEGE